MNGKNMSEDETIYALFLFHEEDQDIGRLCSSFRPYVVEKGMSPCIVRKAIINIWKKLYNRVAWGKFHVLMGTRKFLEMNVENLDLSDEDYGNHLEFPLAEYEELLKNKN